MVLKRNIKDTIKDIFFCGLNQLEVRNFVL